MTKERKIAIVLTFVFVFLIAFIYPAFFFFPDYKVNVDTVESIELITQWVDHTVLVTDPADIEVILDEIDNTIIRGITIRAAAGGVNYQYYRFYLKNGESVEFQYAIEHGETETGWEMFTMEPHVAILFEGRLPSTFEEMFDKYDLKCE